jgi:tetratricopeptide (TPR) repeat protein
VLALADSNRRDAAIAKLLSGAARLAMYSGAINDAIDLARRSVAIWRDVGDRRGLAFALAHEAIPLIVSRQRDAANALMEESKAHFSDLDDPWGIAFAATYMGANLAFEPGAEDAAWPLLAEGRARFHALGDEWGVTTSSHYLGSIALRQADYASARELTEEMLAIARDLGDNYRVSRNLHQLAEIALAENKLTEAREHLTGSLCLNRDQGRVGDAAQQLRMLGRIELMQSRPERAVRAFGAASLHDSRERTLPPDDPKINEAALAAAREALGERRFASEWSLGEAMLLEQAATWAVSSDGHISDAS